MTAEIKNVPIDIYKEFSKEYYTAEDGYTLPYRLYLPRNYDCGKTYPVLVFFHGAGERGNDNTKQIEVALPHIFDNPDSPAYDSIIIAPQCPEDKQWVYTPWANGNYSLDEVTESKELECAFEVIKYITSEYNGDKSRIYVSGLSMGGFATWDMLARHGEVFAAAMPVCGGGDVSRAKFFADIPIRTFHGLLDPAVPCTGTQELYAAVSAYGKGKIRYTEFPEDYHGIWDRVYSDDANIKWLFSNVKKEPAKKKLPKLSNKAKAVGVAGIALGILSAALIIANKKKKK